MGYDKRNPIQRWWLDLEIVSKKVVKPKGVNERDLTLGLDTTGGNSKVAMYPWEKLPKANGTGT